MRDVLCKPTITTEKRINVNTTALVMFWSRDEYFLMCGCILFNNAHV